MKYNSIRCNFKIIAAQIDINSNGDTNNPMNRDTPREQNAEQKL